jgi:dTDP-glucose 4,6-dehydratase
MSNCSNNYGPCQFPEKMIPLMIINALNRKKLPVYGEGENVRDWLYVEDHCDAIWTILNNSQEGEVYNIGGRNEWQNISLVNLICERIASLKGEPESKLKSLIEFVADRPAHDMRYAVNTDKIRKELGWMPKYCFEEGLEMTINWYLNNSNWIRRVMGK